MLQADDRDNRQDAIYKYAGIKLSGSYDHQVSALGLNKLVPGTTRWGQQLLIGLALLAVIIRLGVLMLGRGQR